MLNFIRYKITNKKLLNCSLLVGVIMLAGFLCVYPMFREGSLNRLIQTMFVEQAKETREYPCTIYYTGGVPFDRFESVDKICEEMDGIEKKWASGLTCPQLDTQRVLYVKTGNADTTFGSKSRVVSIGTIPGLYDHADLLYGVKAEEAANSDNDMVKEALANGAYPCVISQSVMDRYGLVVGETLSFKFKMYSGADVSSFVITGIIEEKEEDRFYWHNRLESYKDLLILPYEVYDSIIRKFEINETYYDLAGMYDYTYIDSVNAVSYRGFLKWLNKEDKDVKNNFSNILGSYLIQEKSISLILFAFELPIVALMLLFLYMISSRILEMETTEIAMLKSRGVSRLKIIGVYVLQSSIIAGLGCLIGLPVGYGMCKMAVSTNAFLSFTIKDVSIYEPVLNMILFVILAFLLAVLFMTLPVIGLSKLTITERKGLRISSSGTPLWQKYFFDIALLIVSGYLLYNYYKQKDAMAVQIISGGAVDPVIFLDSSLFILACGLLFLRLTGYLVRLIYHIGKKRWKPAGYVAFLQIIRNAKRQGFITVFLVMTIAMGVFNANLARTVNENVEKRTNYNIGTDYVVQERWVLTTIKLQSGEYTWKYKEPDYERFKLSEDYGVESFTKVMIDESTDIKVGDKLEVGNMLMAISTKEFGETAVLEGNVNDKHWFYYLNALGKNPKGVLISSNLAKKYDLHEGDSIHYLRYSPLDPKKADLDTSAVICGIVDAFPGYESTVYETQSDGSIEPRERYLIVANLQTVINNRRITPYQVWMRLSEDADTEKIEEGLRANKIDIKSISDRKKTIQNQRDSSMIQITNGMFSIGFIISLLICAAGFLIYWILTIKEREMLYGIYRAMGMSMREIVTMLVTEQIFSSLLAALSGFAVGGISTLLFTKLISIVYLPRKHNQPIEIFIKAQDSIKMVIIIGAAFAVCFYIIGRILKDMNITSALKMGED